MAHRPQLPLRCYVFRDVFGRVFLDTCATLEEHLQAPPDPWAGKRTCRFYVDDLLDHLVGKGQVDVIIDYQADLVLNPIVSSMVGRV